MTVKHSRKDQQNSTDWGQIYPVLRRTIEPIPFRAENGQTFVGLRDSIGLSPEILWLPHDLFYILQYFNGFYSCLDIKSAYYRNFSTFLYDEKLQQLISLLDDNFLLDNERCFVKFNEATESFRKLPARPPVCIGNSYPEKPDDLKKQLEDFIRQAKIENHFHFTGSDRVKAVVSPHIDMRAGGPVYGAAYNILAKTRPSDLYVILGIGHQPMSQMLTLTNKDFDTPLGCVQTDEKLVWRIVELSGHDLLADEYFHQNEHSIEFQTIFLKNFIKGDFKILPVLCSFSHHLFSDDHSEEKQYFFDMMKAISQALDEYSGNVCFIASVDLAHVGPRYGDSFQPAPPFLALVEQNDRNVLHALEKRDFAAFQQSVCKNDNQYRICGYAALSAMLMLMPEASGNLLSYGSASMDTSRSTVTFASMVFV